MKRVFWRPGLILSAMLLTLLSACGGGGGSSDSASSVESSITGTEITAVDPYVVGAIFQEISEDGDVRQTSTPSDESGQAVFAQEVQVGSTIEMVSPGLHNGVLFKGILKRKVDQSASDLVVSPLTTLAAELGGNDAVLSVLGSAGLILTEADIEANPMLALDGKLTLASSDLVPLVANLAVNAAINLVGADADNLGFVIAGIAAKLQADDDENGQVDVVDAMQSLEGADVGDCVGSLVGITDLLVNILEQEQAGATISPDIEELMGLVVLPEIKIVVARAVEVGGMVTINPDDISDIGSPAATVRENLEKGYASFGLFNASLTSPVDQLLAAAESFKTAKILIGTDGSTTQADKDEALFFGSLADFVALAKPYSNFTDDGINNLGDILDAFGVEAGPLRSDFDNLPIDNVAPISTTPTSGEFQQALATVLLSRLQVVAEDLAQVSSSFTLKRSETDGTEYDYGDALFLKGLAQAMHAQINMLLAYNLNASLYDLETASMTTQQFLAANPDLGALAPDYATKLAAAKAKLANAADALLAAIDAIEAENAADANQSDDLITFYDENPDVMAEEIAQAKTDLAKFKAGLNGPVAFNEGDEGELTLNFSPLFDGIDLSQKRPAYQGNVPGYFPDPTMGGVIANTAQTDINEDADGDGSPDLLWGYTRFFDDFLMDKTFEWASDGFSYNLHCIPEDNGFILFWYDHTGEFTVGDHFIGTYEIQTDGSLLLTASSPDIFTTLKATLLEPINNKTWEFFVVDISIDGGEPVTTYWW